MKIAFCRNNIHKDGGAKTYRISAFTGMPIGVHHCATTKYTFDCPVTAGAADKKINSKKNGSAAAPAASRLKHA
jgi:hypothetical protein